MRFLGPTLVILHGTGGTGPTERLMAAARRAAMHATIDRALDAGFQAVIAATACPSAIEITRPGLVIDPDPPGEPFSIDRRLRQIVARFGLARPAVMGCGSLPLLTTDDLREVRSVLETRQGCSITNNFYSADLTGWTPGDRIERLRPFTRDNALPRLLRDDAALETVLLPRTTRSQFDLDTPVDLAILGLTPGLSPGVRHAAQAVAGLSRHLESFLPILCDRNAELVVAGRVGSAAWQYLERETACRVRLYSEERGLATAPAGYQPRSALGFLLAELGPERFFARMAELGDGIVVDTRVLEAHTAIQPSREDRFLSDLFGADDITDPWLRAFTRAAASAARPVALGGHSLVSGGLMALNDAAWTALESGRLPG